MKCIVSLSLASIWFRRELWNTQLSVIYITVFFRQKFNVTNDISPKLMFFDLKVSIGSYLDQDYVTLTAYQCPILHRSDNSVAYFIDVGLMIRRSFVALLPPANEVWGKVIFSEVCVKNSVHRGGLSHCMLGYTPPPLRAEAGTHPRSRDRYPPEQPPWSRPPGADTTTPGPEAGTPRAETPRCSACWEIWAKSGRYASYWNAFLFWNVTIISWHANKAFMKRGSLK